MQEGAGLGLLWGDCDRLGFAVWPVFFNVCIGCSRLSGRHELFVSIAPLHLVISNFRLLNLEQRIILNIFLTLLIPHPKQFLILRLLNPHILIIILIQWLPHMEHILLQFLHRCSLPTMFITLMYFILLVIHDVWIGYTGFFYYYIYWYCIVLFIFWV